jgi:dTDP-4-dehydrorhamnose 3,5-epimerase
MQKIETQFDGLFLIENQVFADERGVFFKPYSADDYAGMGLRGDFRENYYSINKAHVIRGMHFQAPPADHAKLVYVSRGSILDVVVDIRLESRTYGRCHAINMDAKRGIGIYIPPGFAHGFMSLENDTIVNYAQTSCYARQEDRGIRYDSIGFDWQCPSPILSERDKSFCAFADYRSPFK